MNKSSIKKDLKNEQILTKWVNDNFLSIYCEKCKISENAQQQHSGVDFVITS